MQNPILNTWTFLCINTDRTFGPEVTLNTPKRIEEMEKRRRDKDEYKERREGRKCLEKGKK